MSAFSTSKPINNTQQVALKKLKDEAVALEGGKLFSEAYEKYEELLSKQQASIGDDHPETMETKHSIMRRRPTTGRTVLRPFMKPLKIVMTKVVMTMRCCYSSRL
jgi:hypothetical protein